MIWRRTRLHFQHQAEYKNVFLDQMVRQSIVPDAPPAPPFVQASNSKEHKTARSFSSYFPLLNYRRPHFYLRSITSLSISSNSFDAAGTSNFSGCSTLSDLITNCLFLFPTISTEVTERNGILKVHSHFCLPESNRFL